MIEILGYLLLTITVILLVYLFYLLKTIEEFEKPKDFGNLPTSLRILIWIGENYKKFFIASIITVLLATTVTAFFIIEKEKQLTLTNEAMKNLAGKAIVLYPNEKIAQLYLSEIKPQAIKYFLDDIVLAYFIWGKVCLFKNQNFATNWKEIPKYCDKVALLLRRKDLFTKEALIDYLQALKGIYALAKTDKLPEIIKPEEIESKISTKRQDGKLFFDYKADVKTHIEYVFLGENRIRFGTGIYKVEIKGYIDPEKGDIKNPFGVKFTSISIGFLFSEFLKMILSSPVTLPTIYTGAFSLSQIFFTLAQSDFLIISPILS